MTPPAGGMARQDRLAAAGLHVLLGIGLAAALLGLDWLSLAPNRLLPGQPVSASQALGAAVLPILALAAAGELALLRGWRILSVLLLLSAFALILIGTGAAADRLLQGRPSAARVMPAAGFWTSLAALAALTLESARRSARGSAALGGLALAALVLGSVALGLLDDLSLVAEYRARAGTLHEALVQHLALSLSALLLALALVLPLGWAAFRRPRLEALANAVLGAVQVTPSIALFGLLIPLLAGLLAAAPGLRAMGLGAIGPAPAVLGVAVYLALPLLRGLTGGLRAADPDAVEAARALGLGEARTTLEVRIPLALPVLAGALRVAVVQSIGLMTLGGLIGAGGLGAIVFAGMAQFAADLILLGALPIIGLALAADFGLAALVRTLERATA